MTAKTVGGSNKIYIKSLCVCPHLSDFHLFTGGDTVHASSSKLYVKTDFRVSPYFSWHSLEEAVVLNFAHIKRPPPKLSEMLGGGDGSVRVCASVHEGGRVSVRKVV